MMRSVLFALGAAALATSAMSSCSGNSGREDVAVQQLANALCDKMLECECLPAPVSQCGDWPLELDFGIAFGPSTRAFSDDCLPLWLDWFDELSCQDPSVAWSDARLCPLYHGTIPEGMPCQALPDRNILLESECARGLVCAGGLCRDPLRTTFGVSGQPCDFYDRCVDESLCYEGMCTSPPGPGEPCLGNACADTARCDAGLCEALPDAGQPCPNGDCAPGAFCATDFVTGQSRCEGLSDLGGPCMGHAQCHSGNCPAGACAPAAQVGDPCSTSQACGGNLVCYSNVCTALAPNGLLPDPTCRTLEVFSRRTQEIGGP